MNSTTLTGTAQRAGDRYSFFLASLTNIYTQALQGGVPGSDHTHKMAVAKAIEVAVTYLGNELPELSNAIEIERLDALSNTQADMELTPDTDSVTGLEHSQAHMSDLENALRVQLERDIASMVRGLRNVALRARIIGTSKGISERTALAQLRQEDTSPSYTYQDRAGRRWPSEKLVRTLVRQSMVFVWNETALLEMGERGITHAIIDHPDESHEQRGTVVSLTEDPMNETVTWDQVRDDVFHPNTSAWLRPFA